jgi:hypothetical protein
MSGEVVFGEFYQFGGRDGTHTRKYLAVNMATELLYSNLAKTSF